MEIGLRHLPYGAKDGSLDADCAENSCRSLIQGHAKNLADRLYGADGPPLGTLFAEMEQIALTVGEELRKRLLDLLLVRQAEALVESMVKQISRRVKGTEKFWGDEGAEAVLQLRADYLSDGEVMEGFWHRQKAATGQRPYRTNS